jgi:TAT (twin-arginine translocation) pathway signal sequence
VTGFDRRTFLAGSAALGGAALLGACGGGSGANNDTNSDATGGLQGVLYQASGTLVSGIDQRIVVGYRNADGSAVSKGPDKVKAGLSDIDGNDLGITLLADRHGDGINKPYWPFTTKFAEPGNFKLTLDEQLTSVSFTVLDPSQAAVPNIGGAMPRLVTPTLKATMGVDPICTKTPFCPLHDITLEAAIASKVPVAFLVGTPAYCQTGVCGPIVDLLMEQQKRLGDKVQFIHNEVYAKPYVDDKTPTTDAVDKLSLNFEPVIWLIGPDGIIRQRLDVIVDKRELTEALDRLLAA